MKLTTAVVILAFVAGCAHPKPAPPIATPPAAHEVEMLAPAPHKAGPAALYSDPDKTPGVANPAVTQANIHQTICRAHWTETIRPPVSYTNALKRQQMQEYGDTVPDPHARCVPHSAKPRCYEEDHFISLELGGDPRDPRNLWPEPYKPVPGARQKDWVETFLKHQVCNGAMTLRDAQRAITADWYATYQVYH